MPRFAGLFFLAALILLNSPAYAESSSNLLETRYATVHYSENDQMNDFLWRITGERLTGQSVLQNTRGRIDEIIERVQSLLDMHPAAFHFDIFLKKNNEGGTIAYYSHETRSITAVASRVTDGVLAHEIAHAIINAYFNPAPPEKSQEILAQYVDQHLWSEAV